MVVLAVVGLMFWKLPPWLVVLSSGAMGWLLGTVKKNIPMRVYLLALVPIFIIGAVVYMKYFTDKQQGKYSEQASPQSDFKQAKASTSGGVGQRGKVVYTEAIEDAKQYVFDQTPRVEGLPHTAPKYDELTKPVEVPVPAGCVQTKSSGCKCYTQQATPIEMPQPICEGIVKHGFFEDFERSKRQKENQPDVTARTEEKSDAEQPNQWVVFANPPVKRQSGQTEKVKEKL